MTLVIPPGFANAAFVFNGSAGTQPYITTLGLDVSDYGGDYVNAANQAMAIFASTMADQVHNSFTLDRVTLSVGSDGPGGSVDSTLTPSAMTRAGTQGPTAMSAIARKVTNELGRRGRGRMFLVGTVTESEVDPDGSIVAGRRTTLNAALLNFYETLVEGDVAGGPLLPVLLHSSAPTDPTPITALAVSDLVGWIRGRIR